MKLTSCGVKSNSFDIAAGCVRNTRHEVEHSRSVTACGEQGARTRHGTMPGKKQGGLI